MATGGSSRGSCSRPGKTPYDIALGLAAQDCKSAKLSLVNFSNQPEAASEHRQHLPSDCSAAKTNALLDLTYGARVARGRLADQSSEVGNEVGLVEVAKILSQGSP